MWWKCKKQPTLYDIEQKVAVARANYDVYARTLFAQGHFTDRQRKELMDLKATQSLAELELNKLKFEEVINGKETAST